MATGISLVIGIALGLIAGFRGGKLDTFISRLIDIVLSLPLLLLAIGVGAACGASVTGCLGGLVKPGIPLVTGIIALFGWPYVARIVRGQTLSLREREFVEAARATGYGNLHIMFREILPNMVASIIVVATLLIPQNILFEAALSFLAVGVPAGTPSWGGMLSDATNGALYRIAWWMLFFPGMFLVITRWPSTSSGTASGMPSTRARGADRSRKGRVEGEATTWSIPYNTGGRGLGRQREGSEVCDRSQTTCGCRIGVTFALVAVACGSSTRIQRLVEPADAPKGGTIREESPEFGWTDASIRPVSTWVRPGA
jgi:ABC-type Fe3+ transport system permease subunit